MKSSSFLKIAVLAMPLMLTSCFLHKKGVKEEAPKPLTAEQQQQKDFVTRVQDNVTTARFLTSKVKFSVEVGAQKLTLTGNLKMKRDDVIRLQLMAFGFVEAGRIEMTKDYVLIMDRINKQYLKAPGCRWISCATVVWTSVRCRLCSGTSCLSPIPSSSVRSPLLPTRQPSIRPLRVVTI